MSHKLLQLIEWFALWGTVVVGASTLISVAAAKVRRRGPSKYTPKTPY